MNKTDVIFVCMPSYSTGLPSYALALFKGELARASSLSSQVVYSNHRMVNFFLEDIRNGLTLGLEDMEFGWELFFAEFTGMCERGIAKRAVLASAEQAKENKNISYLAENWDRLMEKCAAFLEQEADYILSFHPKIVASSLFYQQYNATIALFNLLKKKSPDVITVVGGYLCTPRNSAILVKYVSSIDYVSVGEGDSHIAASYPLLISGDRETLEKHYPYYVYRGKEQPAVLCLTPDLNKTALPDYSDYVNQLAENRFKLSARLPIIYETSRGCWWGRCKFCGLHYENDFRKKSVPHILEEIAALEETYHPSNVSLADCILSNDFINALPDGDTPAIDRYIFAEVKSNLTEQQVRRLKCFGFQSIQPGIESFNDPILKLMDKGNRAIKHVELLKHCRRYGVEVGYNIMCGFYGDREEWYEEQVRLMPLLHHLCPPIMCGGMYLSKGSIFTREMLEIAPESVGFYGNADAAFPPIWEYQDAVTARYHCDRIRASNHVQKITRDAIEEWKREFENNAWLYYEFADNGDVLITDTRKIAKARNTRLFGLEKEIFLRAYSAMKLKTLYAEYENTGRDAVDSAVSSLIDRKLMLKIGEEVLSLATPEDCWEYGHYVESKRSFNTV